MSHELDPQVQLDIDEAINDLIDNIADKYNKPIAGELYVAFSSVVAELAIASGVDETTFIMGCIETFRAARKVELGKMN